MTVKLNLSGSQYDVYFRKSGDSCARQETGKMKSYKESLRYFHYNELCKCTQRSRPQRFVREVLIIKPNLGSVTVGHGVSNKNKEIQSMQYEVLEAFCIQNSDIVPNS